MHEPGSMDISQHKGMYGAFVTLTKAAIVGSVILLVGMAIFLV